MQIKVGIGFLRFLNSRIQFPVMTKTRYAMNPQIHCFIQNPNA